MSICIRHRKRLSFVIGHHVGQCHGVMVISPEHRAAALQDEGGRERSGLSYGDGESQSEITSYIVCCWASVGCGAAK